MKLALNRTFVLFTFLVVCMSMSRANAAEVWQWQPPCRAGDATTCGVWFNTLDRGQAPQVTHNGRVLESRFETYADRGSVSANVFLMQVNGLTETSLRRVQSAMAAAIQSMNSHQKLALYQAGSDLRVLSSLATPSSQSVSAARSLAISQVSPASLDQLYEVLKIMPPMAPERKVLYWITSGVVLTSSEQAALIEKLSASTIRVVFVHLQTSELAINEGASLRAVAGSLGTVYKSVAFGDWEQVLSSLPAFSDNGGVITINTADLCGENTLEFSAALSTATSATASWTGNFTNCSAVVPPIVSPVETEAPVEPSVEPNAELPSDPNGELPVDPNGELPVDPNGELPVDPYGEQPWDPNSELPLERNDEPPSGPIGDPETHTDMPPEPDNRRWFIWAAGFGLLVCLGLLIFLMRRRGVVPASTQAPSIQQQTTSASVPPSDILPWGYLLEFTVQGEVWHPLTKPTITIGRGESHDIDLSKDDSVSTDHALIKRDRSGGVTIIDIKSTNKVIVDNEEVREHTLKGGEVIQLGSTTLRYEKR